MPKKVIDLGVDIDVKIAWVEKLKTQYSSVLGAEKTVAELAKVLGGLQAISRGISMLNNAGASNSVAAYVKEVNKLMSSIEKLKVPQMPSPSDIISRLGGPRPTKKSINLPKYWEKGEVEDTYLLNQEKMRRDLQAKNRIKVSREYPEGTFAGLIEEKATALTDKEMPDAIKRAQKQFDKASAEARKRFEADVRQYDAQAKKLQAEYDKLTNEAIRKIDIINKLMSTYSKKLDAMVEKIADRIVKANEAGLFREPDEDEIKNLVKGREGYEKTSGKDRAQEEREMAARIAQQVREEDAAQYKAHQALIKQQRQEALIQAKREAKLQGLSEVSAVTNPQDIKTTEQLQIQLKLREQLLKISRQDAAEAEKAVRAAINAGKTKEEIDEKTLRMQEAIKNVRNDEKQLDNLKLRGKEIAAQEQQEKAAHDRRMSQYKKDIEALIREKKERQEITSQTEKLNDIIRNIGTSKKLTFHEALDEIRKVNYELHKFPQSIRSAKIDEMQKQLHMAGIQTKRIGDNLELVAGESSRVESHITAILKDMFSWQKILSRVSFVLTAVTSYQAFDVVKRTISGAFKTNIDFRNEMSKTFAIMRKELGDNVEFAEQKKRQFEDAVSGLAKAYHISLKNAAEGFYQIISAQFTGADALRVLDASMKLAVGGFADLNDAALSLVQTLNAFDLSAESAAHVADVMFETTRLGIITTQQYSEQMSKVASTASLFGLNIEEVSAAISSMTRNGVKVDQAFTSLNQLLMTIANPTQEATKMMQEYGVTLDMNIVRAKGLIGAIQGLGSMLESEEAMTTLVKSRTGFKAIASLAQNQEDYLKDLVDIYGSMGAAEEATAERLATTSAKIDELKTKVTDFGLSVGRELESPFRNFISTITALLGALVKSLWALVPAIKGVIAGFLSFKTINTLIQGNLLLGTRLQLLWINIKTIFTTSFRSILQVFVALGLSVKTLVLNLVGAKTAAQAAGAAMAAAWAEATLGLSIIISAVIGLFGILSNASKRKKELSIYEIMGIGDVDIKLKAAQDEVDKLDTKIASLHGFRTMIEQMEELADNTSITKEQTELLNESVIYLIETLRTQYNIEIEGGNIKAQLSNAYIRLTDLETEALLEKSDALLLVQSIEAKKAYAEYASAYFTDKGNARIGVAFQRRQIGTGYVGDFDTRIKETLDAGMDVITSTYNEIIQTDWTKKTAEERAAFQKEKNTLIDNTFNPLIKELSAINKDATGWTQAAAAEAHTVGLNLELFAQSAKNAVDSINGIVVDKSKTNLEALLDTMRRMSPPAKAISGGGKQKELKDKVKDVYDKYTDLFRNFGISYDTKSQEKLQDIQDYITELIASGDNILPSSDIIDTLNKFGQFSLQFGELSEIFKKKNRTISDVTQNLALLQTKLKTIKEEDIQQYVNMLNATGIPELQRLASNLNEIVIGLIEENTEKIDAYLEEELSKLISKVKTPKEAIEIVRKIVEEVYPEFFVKVSQASLDELEEMLKDNSTPKSVSTYINNVIDEYKKRLGNSIKSLVSKYGYILEDIEDNMNDISDLFSFLRDKLKPFGIKMEDFTDIVAALALGDTKKVAKFIDRLSQDQQEAFAPILRSIEENEAIIAENNLTIAKNEKLIQTYDRAIKNLQNKKLEIGTETRKKVMVADVSAMISTIMSELSAKKAGIGSRKAGETDEEFVSRLLKRASQWSGFNELRKAIAGQKSLEEQLRAYYADKNRKVPETEQEVVVTTLSDKDRQLLLYYDANLEDNTSKLAMLTESTDKLKDINNALNATNQNLKQEGDINTIIEMIKNNPVFKDLLPLGFEDYTPAEQRKFVYENIRGRTPAQEPLTKIGDLTKEEIGDLLKEQFNIEELTIGDALSLVGSKLTEIGQQAWSQYWDGRIRAAEEAKDRLLEIEDEYIEGVQSKSKMMLANENMSAEQREAINARLEEEKRKSEERKQEIQEEFDRKSAQEKKKQAKWELAIEFAKSIAMIWARQLSKEGPLGTVSAAVLTGILATLFAAQLALINGQKFAEGGYTGSGMGTPDETGQRPAGIVHEGELVFPKEVVDRNFSELMGMYSSLKSGVDFNSFLFNHILKGSKPASTFRNTSGFYASGGYVHQRAISDSEPIIIDINLSGANVIDDIELHRRVEIGGRKRRYIVNG